MFTAATLFFILAFGIAFWMHNQWQTEFTAQPGDQPGHHPFISVIIPARNEARNIGRCVEALLAQTYPDYEVLVYDDHSDDDTAAIVGRLAGKDGRVQLITGGELADGWAGKPNALWQAQAHAKGKWLCFIDADTFAKPELLESALAAAERYEADLFSMLSDQELVTFWEKVVQPLVFTAISASHAPKRVNDPEKPDAIANGQFILIKRGVYDAVGGHRAVWDSVIEDLALARVVKNAGYRLAIADGRELASTRMYTSLAEIWEGWTKNIFLGLNGRWGWLAFGIIGSLLTTFVLPLWPFLGVYWYLDGGGAEAAWVIVQALVFWGYLLYMRAQAARAFNVSGWYAFTLPLAALVMLGMMLTSTWRIFTGTGVTWKGRTYTG